jgi:hypothetical protein
MKRWNKNKKQMVYTGEEFEEFINELKLLCEKYDYSISHEDKNGSFIFEKYRPENIEWLEEAMISFED